MPVAKSYQTYATLGEPYERNKKMYITVESPKGPKEVRWYTDIEYARLYPEEEMPKVRLRPVKEVLGFDKGYITIFKGDTEAHRDWLKSVGAIYRTLWGWAIESTLDVPDSIPEGLTPIRLLWEDVRDPGSEGILAADKVRQKVEAMLSADSPSRWQGVVGDRVEVFVKVTRAIPQETRYGRSTFHTFEDDLGNVYTWNTGARSLEVGKIYCLRGGIKAHTLYKGIQQTELTRCREV